MKYMKKAFVVAVICVLVVISVAAVHTGPDPSRVGSFIEPSIQQEGDSSMGYDYLINGDYLKSGIAYNLYVLLNGKDKKNFLGRAGKAANVPYNFNLIETGNNQQVVVLNCLQCHGQVFDNRLVIGLGNTFLDFSKSPKKNDLKGNVARHLLQLIAPSAYQSSNEM